MKNIGNAKIEILSKLLKIDGFCIHPFLRKSIFFLSFVVIESSGKFKDEISFVSSGIVPSFRLFTNKTIANSINAINTNPIHTIRYRSMAFKFREIGAFPFAALKMLIKTKKIVTSNPILAGTTSGFTIKETQETITNIDEVK